MLRLLLKLSAAVRSNRWAGVGVVGKVGLAVAVLGGAAGLILGGDAVLRPTAEGLAFRVENWAFWCMTLSALVFGYSSFEVMYREPVARRMGTQPIDAASLFWWKVVTVYRVHLPLVLLPALSGVCLLQHGHTAAWLSGVGAALGALLWGLAAAIYAHVWAGSSLLDGGSDLKGYLVQGFGPPETAFLFYSPAMALTGALAIGMLCDLALGTALDQGIWGPLQVVAAGLTVVAGICLIRAKQTFAGAWHRIAPKFEDAEVVPPFREGELPQTYLGEGLAAYLSPRLALLWRRDLIQYRRRYRVTIPTLVIVCLLLVLWGMRTAGAPGGGLRLMLTVVSLAVLAFVPVFRLAGPELGARFDARALPVDSRDEVRIQWLLAATEWLPLAIAATLGALLGGAPGAAALVLVGVLLSFGAVNAVAIPMALKSAPDIGRVMWVVRGGTLLMVGLLAGVARILG